MISRSIRVLTIAALVATPCLAQESAAILDAPLVVDDELHMITDVLDLDGDGFADAAGWWGTSTSTPGNAWISIWQNDRAGRLVRTQDELVTYPIYQGEYSPRALSTAADLEGDGDDDWILALNHDILVLRSDGFGQVTLDQRFHAGWRPDALAIADFNGDDRLDIAALGAGFRIFLQDQAGQFALFDSLTGFGYGTELVAVEATGDTTPDLAFVQGVNVRIFPVVDGVVQNTPALITHGLADAFLTAGDIDGDRDVDLVVFGDGLHRVLRRTGPSSFTADPTRVGGPATDLVDIDGDGDLDGACCGSGGPTTPKNDNPSTFRVCHNDGAGVFSSAYEIPGLGARKLAGATDLDHDGDVDLIAGRAVYYAPGPIRSAPAPTVGTRPQSDRTLVDFDGDGDLDLECGVDGVLRSAGRGEYRPFAPRMDEPPAGMVFVGPGFPGDFDGDGDADLIVAMEDGVGTFISMRLLLNNGGGGYTDGGDAAALGEDFMWHASFARTPERSLAVDLDQDGDLDLVTRNWKDWDTHSKLYLNDGTGFFTFQQELLFDSVRAVGDLNGDTIPDLLTTSWNTVRFGWGLGGGAFSEPAGSLGGILAPATDDYAVEDFDGDGDLDVAVAWDNDNGPPHSFNSYLYENDGFGNFTQIDLDADVEAPTSTPVSISSVDFNDDGRPDLAIGPAVEAESAVQILLRRSDNTGWEPPVLQTVFTELGNGAVVRGLVGADVDGDGDEDVLTDRRFSNRTYEGATAGSRKQLGLSQHSADGMLPTWGSTGPNRPGEATELRLTGAAPGVTGVFTAGYRRTPFAVPTPAANAFYITHRYEFTTTGLVTDPEGTGTWTLAYTVPGYKAGRQYHYQVELYDPTATNGIARPNVLVIHYGE